MNIPLAIAVSLFVVGIFLISLFRLNYVATAASLFIVGIFVVGYSGFNLDYRTEIVGACLVVLSGACVVAILWGQEPE